MTTRTRKTEEQRKHEYYSALVTLLRQGRIHRMAVDGHAEHTFADGEHVDFYASGTYTGFAYMVAYGAQGYECGCKSYEHRHSCEHTKDAAAKSAARYHEAQRQHELATAEQVAPLIVGDQFASDLQAHAVDALASQEPDVFECVYKALVFGTINHLDDIMHRAKLVECELTTNALEVLRANGRIIVRKVERGVFWVDTPDQAYRSAYYGDFAA